MNEMQHNSRAGRGVARLGVVVPVSNTNLEPDMQMMRPPGVSVHVMRAGGYDLDQIPDSEQMGQFAETSLEPVLDALCATRPDAVVYGCTSATLSHGPDYDRAFCSRLASLFCLGFTVYFSALPACRPHLGATLSVYTDLLGCFRGWPLNIAGGGLEFLAGKNFFISSSEPLCFFLGEGVHKFATLLYLFQVCANLFI